MGCVFSFFQAAFMKSEESDCVERKQDKKESMFKWKSRSKEVLIQSQNSSIISPSRHPQRGKHSSNIPYSSLEDTTNEGVSVYDAVAARDKDLLQKLVLSGSVETGPYNLCEKKKTNPVEMACSLGYTDIVEVFLDNGCSPNLPTSLGRLIHSVLESMKCGTITSFDGEKLVQRLCDSDCDVNICDARRNSTLLYAAELGNSTVLEIILKRSSNVLLSQRCGGSLYTPLHMSAMRGDTDCVRLLLKYSPSKHVNTRDIHGNTALILALKSMKHNLGYLNSARKELENDSKRSIQQLQNEKSKFLKFQYCSVSVVESLILGGADVNISQIDTGSYINKTHTSPLTYALALCRMDETSFEETTHGHEYSNTMQLVSTKTICSLTEESMKMDHKPFVYHTRLKEKFSVYAGVVRLIVLAGAVKDENLAECRHNSPLLEEVWDFWARNEETKPPKLMHLAKQAVRNALARLESLHEIDKLPLPERLRNYVKLNCL